MENKQLHPGFPRATIQTLAFVAVLYFTWIAAWMLERYLEQHNPWLTTADGQFVYWTTMKLILWILPAIGFIHLSGRRFREEVAFHRIRKAVIWGSTIGLLLAVTSLIPKALNHQPLFPASLSWALINMAIVAPIVEEITFRGAVLGTLLQNHRFGLANTITAFLFVVAHMPGWYFQGKLVEMLTHPIGGALSIFFVGWLLGVVAFRSQSLAGSIIAHSVNNFFS